MSGLVGGLPLVGGLSLGGLGSLRGLLLGLLSLVGRLTVLGRLRGLSLLGLLPLLGLLALVVAGGLPWGFRRRLPRGGCVRHTSLRYSAVRRRGPPLSGFRTVVVLTQDLLRMSLGFRLGTRSAGRPGPYRRPNRDRPLSTLAQKPESSGPGSAVTAEEARSAGASARTV